MGVALPVNALLHGSLARVCESVITAGDAPGGVLWVGQRDDILDAFPFGNRALEPSPEPATLDTIYDLASLTKPFVTAVLVLKAVEAGLMTLRDPLRRWFEIDASNPVGDTEPHQLLLHTSGLPAGREIPAGTQPGDALIAALCSGGLESEPGTEFVYSDVGYHLLAHLLERAFDEPLEALAQRLVFAPLGTRDLRYGVPDHQLYRTAPTERVDGTVLRGVVHDPVARLLGGVCGHAGLFGTAADCARLCRMILRRGEIEGERILSSATVDRMVASVAVPGGRARSLGWDVDTHYSSPRGEVFSTHGVGHTGFTGPSVWIDLESGVYIVIMTNRVHPDGDGDVVRLRRLVANVVAAAASH